MDQSYSGNYESTSAGAAVFGGVWMLVWLAAMVVAIAGLWKVFNKAGHSGLKALVPIYNTYIMLKIAGRPGWWLLLMFIPFVNLIVAIILSLDMAKAFGKSAVFGIVGLFLFAPIGYAMLGFGPAKYVGSNPNTKPAAPATPAA